jgi:hypothetical protein
MQLILFQFSIQIKIREMVLFFTKMNGSLLIETTSRKNFQRGQALSVSPIILEKHPEQLLQPDIQHRDIF